MFLLPLLLQAAQPAPMTMPVPAHTAEPVVTCPPAVPEPLTPDLVGWNSISASPAIGRAFTLQTIDPTTARFAFPIDTSHPGRVATAQVSVERAGTYQIAISRGGWIDVFDGDRRVPLASSAHRHGPACSGIRKVVSFRLEPGTHWLAVTGMMGHDVRVLVAPVP